MRERTEKIRGLDKLVYNQEENRYYRNPELEIIIDATVDLTSPVFFDEETQTLDVRYVEANNGEFVRDILVPFLLQHPEVKTLKYVPAQFWVVSTQVIEIAKVHSLEAIELEASDLKDKDLTNLLENPNLKYLRFHGSYVTNPCAAQLLTRNIIIELDNPHKDYIDLDTGETMYFDFPQDDVIAALKSHNMFARNACARRHGIQTEVPSLLQYSLFNFKNSAILDTLENRELVGPVLEDFEEIEELGFLYKS